MGTPSTQLSLAANVADLIFVDINNQTYQYESFDFVIYDGNKNVVRKGCFRAPSVQLRTNHLEEGTYFLELLLHGKVWETAQFKKQTDLFAFA